MICKRGYLPHRPRVTRRWRRCSALAGCWCGCSPALAAALVVQLGGCGSAGGAVRPGAAGCSAGSAGWRRRGGRRPGPIRGSGRSWRRRSGDAGAGRGPDPGNDPGKGWHAFGVAGGCRPAPRPRGGGAGRFFPRIVPGFPGFPRIGLAIRGSVWSLVLPSGFELFPGFPGSSPKYEQRGSEEREMVNWWNKCQRGKDPGNPGNGCELWPAAEPAGGGGGVVGGRPGDGGDGEHHQGVEGVVVRAWAVRG